ncbi:hypothetical protein ACP70R_036593 [Stipagrostis hirtigluma subsp. patula]
MAAEAKAESPAPPRPSPEKRALPGDTAEEERPPEPKRRRARVAALDSVPCATAASPGAEEEEVDEPGSGCDGDGASFSFQRARGGFVALETTPKFGSFNPPAAAEQAALDQKPAPPDAEDSPEGEAPARGEEDEAEGKDGNSQFVGVEVDGQDQTSTTARS